MATCTLQGKKFYCREWAFQKLLHSLESRPASKTCGTLIMGGPGSGKTAICSEIVWPTSNHGKQRSLNKRMLAYHMCQAHDLDTLSVPNFILGLVSLISRSTLIHGYDEKLRNPSVQAVLEPAACEKNPDEAFKNGILQPLCSLNPPSRNCFILVDSIDEAYPRLDGDRCSTSRTIAELLANHHELFPSWLCLICSARRQSKSVTRMFTGFRKLSLDDLRKSHVVRDVQQYILCRLDREELLRQQLSRDTAEMLNQLHIKSNGCMMYLEKVLDGVANNFIQLKEISDIPGTLNGLYLWLCHRVFIKKQFVRIRPIFNAMLAAQCPLTDAELYACSRTQNTSLTEADFQERLVKMGQFLVRGKDQKLLIFHYSFVEWLLDVKHCTRKYLCSMAEGHAMIAMRYSCEAPSLTPAQVQNFAANLLQARFVPPLEPHHLTLWLMWMGTPLKDCLMSSTPKSQQVLQLLVSAGAKVIDLDESSIALQDALDREDSLKSLLESGASINQVDSNGRSLLANAAYCGNLRVVKFLLARGADSTITDRTGQTALGLAARQGHCEVVGVLIEYHAELDHVDHDGWTPLRSAAWAGHADVVAALLAAGAKVDCSDTDKRTALRAAAWGGHCDIVMNLVEHGADVNQADNEGRTPLIAAAYMGHKKIVEYLLDNGADINHVDCDGRTALSVAAMSVAVCQGHTSVITILIERGANADHSDNDGMSPLIVAASEGHQTVVELLLEGDADIDHTDNNNRTALIAASNMRHTNVVKTLLYWDAAVDTIDNEGRTVLSIAAAEGNAEVVRMLLDRGLDEMHKDHHGWTPLHMAAYGGHREVCRVFLSQNSHVSVDIMDRDGRTPLTLAAQEGKLETVKELLNYNANIHHTAHDGRSVLRAASLEGHQEVVRLLVEGDADVNYKDAEGRSTLYMLALENKVPMAHFLLECGADTENPDFEGRTPLHVASWQGHTEMVNVLLSFKANPNAMDKEKRSVLQSAAWQGHVMVANSLLQKGADINHTCNQGASALCIAAQEGHVDVVKCLLEHGADPAQSDKHGRTAMKVALKGGHQAIIKLLEKCGVPNPLSPMPSRAAHNRKNGCGTGGSSSSNQSSENAKTASSGILANGGLMQASSSSNSPDSTFDQRKSSVSNQSSKSSSNLTSVSTVNSTLHLHPPKENGQRCSTFTEQLQHLAPHGKKKSGSSHGKAPEPSRNQSVLAKVTPASSFQTIPENIITTHSTDKMQHGNSKPHTGAVQSPRRSPSPHISSRSTSPSLQPSSPLSQASLQSPVRLSPQTSPSHCQYHNNNKPLFPFKNPQCTSQVSVEVHSNPEVRSASPQPRMGIHKSPKIERKARSSSLREKKSSNPQMPPQNGHNHINGQAPYQPQPQGHQHQSLQHIPAANGTHHNPHQMQSQGFHPFYSPPSQRRFQPPMQPQCCHRTGAQTPEQSPEHRPPVHQRSISQPVHMVECHCHEHVHFQRKASLPVSFNQINLQRVLSTTQVAPGSPEMRPRRNGIVTNPKYKNYHNKTSLHGSQTMLTQQPSIIAGDNHRGLSALELKQAMKASFEGSCRNGFKKETPL
ncbi:ankyrin repeat domain-containing protein 50-like [Patiria miniata]|uniref:Ankyrin repeat domain-containing protein 50 n=1 Tax=Patiria miniata TaxID=46514 RepID=A0A913ZWR9_PATMI|nr:ankyrin repeat domain-containing protein 50-like [Patiria miniata]XP_038055512.1 ankyrin repeat domain-containing protein 50-like [Patiria miniata]XP_038055513.1 ankyrin repeat domain-containing protein 50-like [Patiria miniata]XP_038055514.1 ankyrin repeat domain-containing protein 50-like [Patiria miniata]